VEKVGYGHVSTHYRDENYGDLASSIHFALTALFWGRLYQRMILSQFYRPLGAARDSE